MATNSRHPPPITSNCPSGSLWINRLGLPLARPDVYRILCLKLDHIGDLFVADTSLRLLREYFPESHITLLCGPWNVDLANRLRLADVVVPVNFFHSTGAAQHDEKVATEMRRQGLAELSRLNIGDFDLAIDLRIDDDTRDLLKLFRATVYAGHGNLSRFPYLDISLPVPDVHLNAGPDSFRLVSQDFIAGNGFEARSFGLGFPKPVAMVDLEFRVAGAKTPKQCGTAPDDDRLLGVGLREIEVFGTGGEGARGGTRFLGKRSFATGSSDTTMLQSGWAQPEHWGTWSNAASATLELPISEDLDGVDELWLQISLVAHINEGNPYLDLEVIETRSGRRATRRCELPNNEITVSLDVPLFRKWGVARSRPFVLRAGRYGVDLETYRPDTTKTHRLFFRVVGSMPERTVLFSEFEVGPSDPMRTRLSANLEVVDPAEPLRLEVGPSGTNGNAGIFIVSLTGNAVFVAPAKIPSAHMESRLAHLVFAVALELSPIFYSRPSPTPSALTTLVDSDRAALGDTEIQRCLALKRAGNKVLVGIGLGATKETKRWPFPYFLEFCQLLLTSAEVVLVFCGGTAEISESAQVEQALAVGDRVINVSGRTPLNALGVVLGMLDMYIGYDTGTTHYAGKTGVRTVGIFSAVHSPREWGPVGQNATWITHYTECSPCYLAKLEDCRFGHACMLDLRPHDCWQLIVPILEEMALAKSQLIGLESRSKENKCLDIQVPVDPPYADVSISEDPLESRDLHNAATMYSVSAKRNVLASGSLKEILCSKICWARLDIGFYTGQLPGLDRETDEDLLIDHYLYEGVRSGLSPNQWFDEEFYRLDNPIAAMEVRRGDWVSGFEHYCRVGYRDRSPHWLFDPEFYFERNPTLTERALTRSDFVNLYDHYIQFGALEGRLAHRFLDPSVYISGLDPDLADDCAQVGAFKHFVTRRWLSLSDATKEPISSPLFDPALYLAGRPELEAQIKAAAWHSALHHYLVSSKNDKIEIRSIQEA